MRIKKRAIAVVACSAIAMGGLTACNDEEGDKKQSTEQSDQNSDGGFEDGYQDENWDNPDN